MLGTLGGRIGRVFGSLALAAVMVVGLGIGAEPASAAAGFSSAPAPKISGTLKVGATLTAALGTWRPSPTTTSYQWYRGSVAITGAKKSTYVLTAADYKHTMRVRVTRSRGGYVKTSRVSAASAPVARGTFTSAPTPTVSGSVKVGARLTAVPGTWRPAPTAMSYQWYRGTVAITGSTKSTYVLGTADYKHSIKVKVTAARSGYVKTSRTSVATALVAKATFSSSPAPTITGTAKVGSVVTAVPGAWAPAGATFRYQWKANGTAIPGATSATFTPGFAQEGASLTVTVTGSKSYFTSKSVTSSPVTVAAPAVLRVNESLTAGKELRSPSGAYRLVMQSDGNLVLYGSAGAVWATGSGDAVHVTMQSDGNLVSYNSAGAARWESGSWGTAGSYLTIQDDGNLVIYDAGGKAAWTRGVVGWIKVYPGSTAGGQAGTQSQSAANLSSTLFRVYPVGTRLPVVCGTTNGQAVDGSATPGTGKSSTWHRLLWGDWVADADFNTTVNGLVPRGTIGFVANEPDCGGGSQPSNRPGINGWVFPIQPHSTLTTYPGHNGDDFPVGIGTPVYAMYGGTVSLPAPYAVTAGWCPVSSAIGRTQQDLIVMSTRDGHSYRFDYAHMSSFSVRSGQTVQAGDLLGYSGDRGCVTGPHLHVDIKLDGVANRIYPHDLIGRSY